MNWLCKIFWHRYPYIAELGYDIRQSKDVLMASHTCNRCGFFNQRRYEQEKRGYELIRGLKKTKGMKSKEITEEFRYCKSCGDELELGDFAYHYCMKCMKIYIFLKAREEMDDFLEQRNEITANNQISSD